MSWKEKWTFIKPKGVDHEVDGPDGPQTLKFYPVSMSSLFTLKAIANPIARAFASLFQSEDNDVGIVDRTSGDGQMNGQFTTEKIVKPVAMDMAKFRLQQKQQAMEEAVQVLFDPDNARTIMRLIMDSLRDEFERSMSEEQKNEVAEELLSTLDGVHFRQLLTGLFKGNKKVFGPLADMVAQSKDLRSQKMRGLLGSNEENEETEENEENETTEATG